MAVQRGWVNDFGNGAREGGAAFWGKGCQTQTTGGMRVKKLPLGSSENGGVPRTLVMGDFTSKHLSQGYVSLTKTTKIVKEKRKLQLGGGIGLSFRRGASGKLSGKG